MGEEKITLKDLVMLFSTLGMLLSILVLVSVLGSLELDKITFAEAVKKSIIWMIICILSVIGIIKAERDSDEY